MLTEKEKAALDRYITSPPDEPKEEKSMEGWDDDEE